MSFPGDFIELLADNLIRLPVEPGGPSITVVERSVRPTDPNATIGLKADQWSPGEFEIGWQEPAFARYLIYVQLLVKHIQEEEGRSLHSSLSKSLRTMLYRDESLRVGLHGLSDSESGVVESVQRYGVTRQRFLSNELNKKFLFVSSLDLWIEVTSR